jgi:tRNA dimethylallyltransferase
MLRSGWEDEVRSLVECVEPDVPAWNATGYRSIREVVTGELTLDVARTRVIIDTRQYAKRQRTWFRHQLRPDDVVHLDATTRDAQKQAFAWWRTGESM